MKPVVLISLLALSAAALTALLARSWLERATPAPAEAAVTAEILVLDHDLAPGTVLKADDLRYEPWPASAISPRLTSRAGTEDGRAAFAGKVVRRQLFAGEPLTAEAIAQRDNAGLMASMLSAGMRAVSIPISSPSAVSGFITPGDLVDVVVAADLSHALEGAQPANAAANSRPVPDEKLLRYAAETVLRDIRVLAIDQQVARAADGAAVQGKTATVAVTPKQAETLAVASLLGPLQLVLRGEAADPVAPAKSFSGDLETSQALRSLTGVHLGPQVQVNRAGAVTMEGFAR